MPLKRKVTPPMSRAVRARYSGGSSKASRGAVAKMPLYRLMSRVQNRNHSVMMGGFTQYFYQPSVGLIGPSINAFDIQMTFTAQGCYVTFGASATPFLAFQHVNFNNLCGTFDQYRMTKVVIEVVFSSNNSSVNSPVTSLPTLFAVIDSDDSAPLVSTSIALAYSSCKTMQLGNSSGPNNGKQYLYVNQPTVQSTVGTAVGATTSALGSLRRSPWLNTDQPGVAHFGAKFHVDPAASTATTVEGSVQFIIRSFFDFRNTK